jgi:uncharacterized protein YlxP (DUF503 family)
MPAIIARGRWVLRIPDCPSLKHKRRVVHSLRDRIRARFRVSAAETDYQDNRQMTEISAVLVASDAGVAESILGRMDALVCSDPRAYVVERETGIL